MIQMGMVRALVVIALVSACGSASPEGTTPSDALLPCDRVELLARTDRPDAVNQELRYLEADYQGAPGTPTSHVHARVRPGTDPTPLATRFGASLRSVEGWHLFVFSDADAAKAAMPTILCDPDVLEASVKLEPALR